MTDAPGPRGIGWKAQIPPSSRYLSGGQPHSLRGIENASVLLTILLR